MPDYRLYYRISHDDLRSANLAFKGLTPIVRFVGSVYGVPKEDGSLDLYANDNQPLGSFANAMPRFDDQQVEYVDSFQRWMESGAKDFWERMLRRTCSTLEQLRGNLAGVEVEFAEAITVLGSLLVRETHTWIFAVRPPFYADITDFNSLLGERLDKTLPVQYEAPDAPTVTAAILRAFPSLSRAWKIPFQLQFESEYMTTVLDDASARERLRFETLKKAWVKALDLRENAA